MMEEIKAILHKADWMKTIVGIAIIVVFSSMVFTVTTQEIPKENREIIIHILGIVEGALMAIVTYYFGSSKGSQEKQEMLKRNSEKLS